MTEYIFELKVAEDRLYPTEKMPHYATTGSAAFDIILAPIEWEECLSQLLIKPKEIVMLQTGLFIKKMSSNMFLDVRLRSSIAKQGLVFVGSGVIDSDYRDEILIPVYNTTEETIFLNIFDRIAQGILIPIVRTGLEIKQEIRKGGFGSTGK